MKRKIMVLDRKAYVYLLQWKNKIERKPLIIRGARQVGKSTLIRQFSKEFKYYIEISLEKEENRQLFEGDYTVSEIFELIHLRHEIPKTKHETLIFLDEIQESPKAIKALRFFYEEHPEYFVIAAGSLLEFALKKVASFPVGRVEQYVLHPFDFEEFLMAFGRQNALDELNNFPVNDYAHEVLIKYFHEYAMIGGMPEIVKNYVRYQSVINLDGIFQNLWQAYKDDAEKYASNNTERQVIRHILATAPSEKDRIHFAGFGNSGYKSNDVAQALRALDLARVIQLIYPTTDIKPPIVPNLKRKPRLQFLDTGLFNHSLGMIPHMIGIKDLNNFAQGRIIHQLVTQQIQAQNYYPGFKPMFWVREKTNSNAEIDVVVQHGQFVIPVEIKSGKQGRLRSMHQYIEQADHKFGVRMLANRLSVENVKTPGGTPYRLLNLPYYLSGKVKEYLEWFLHNS